MNQQHRVLATVWTATSWHTDSLCGIAQTIWADPNGDYAAIRHNIIEGGFFSSCDRCSSELLAVDGENFDYEQDAIDAFVLRDWRMYDGMILCAQCARTYHDIEDEEGE